jgi:hypothetical protein
VSGINIKDLGELEIIDYVASRMEKERFDIVVLDIMGVQGI